MLVQYTKVSGALYTAKGLALQLRWVMGSHVGVGPLTNALLPEHNSKHIHVQVYSLVPGLPNVHIPQYIHVYIEYTSSIPGGFPGLSSLPAGFLMFMGWRLCGALVQFDCYQHRYEWMFICPIYIRLSLESSCMIACMNFNNFVDMPHRYSGKYVCDMLMAGHRCSFRFLLPFVDIMWLTQHPGGLRYLYHGCSWAPLNLLFIPLVLLCVCVLYNYINHSSRIYETIGTNFGRLCYNTVCMQFCWATIPLFNSAFCVSQTGKPLDHMIPWLLRLHRTWPGNAVTVAVYPLMDLGGAVKWGLPMKDRKVLAITS